MTLRLFTRDSHVHIPQINIVGCGPGSPDYLTQEAITVVKEVFSIVGYDRLMELFPWLRRERSLLDQISRSGLEQD